MTQNPEEARFYATSSTTVLNDLLADTATRLGGRLLTHREEPLSPGEARTWLSRRDGYTAALAQRGELGTATGRLSGSRSNRAVISGVSAPARCGRRHARGSLSCSRGSLYGEGGR
ncbi:hypothetical protein [Nocardiopsis sp. LOL_012]|uniref:hypothetical protein n=1 Tax=Nocardiopsis sp. LOL_012 TaxID=3345409 RepID=UPI003A8570B7